MKNRFYIKIIMLLSLIVLVLFSAHYFLYREIKIKNEKISLEQQEIDIQNRRQNYLISTQKLLDSMSSDMEDINNSIVAQDGDVAFIENIESLAKNNGLEVSLGSLVFNDIQSLGATNVKEFHLSVKTSGSWSGTYTFLSQIESLPVKVKLEKFNLVSSTGQDQTGDKKPTSVWNGDFSLVVLKYK